MVHHVIIRLGPQDNYKAKAAGGDVQVPFAFERPGDPHAVRMNVPDVLRRHASMPPAVVEDLLRLAASVYCADTRVSRSVGHDGWARWFRLHLPVRQPDLWQSVEKDLSEMLSFLTGDRWELCFRRSKYKQQMSSRQVQLLPAPPTAVSLFSGGLDSFIGAIDRLESGEPLGLVSHYSTGTTSTAQSHTLAVLNKHYEGLVHHYGFFVAPPPLAGNVPEPTTRSRSILFFALGVLTASGIGRSVQLVVPENGLISLNPPLTPARTGSCSTRTTHPHYVTLFRTVLEGLKIPTEIILPYRFKTKGQMAAGVLNKKVLREGVHQTVSCSHPDAGRFLGQTPGEHCGYCVPCIIRRASLRVAGLDKPSRYVCNVLEDPPSADTTKGRDLRAFQMAARRFDPKGGDRHLFDMLSAGPVPPEDVNGYLAVYRKGMQEIRSFLGIGSRRVKT